MNILLNRLSEAQCQFVFKIKKGPLLKTLLLAGAMLTLPVITNAEKNQDDFKDKVENVIDGKIWGFTLEEIEAGGGAKAFFAANKEALRAYADANGIKYKGNEKFLLIRFNSAVKLQVTRKSIADSEKNIADSEKNIADSEKNIADSKKKVDKLAADRLAALKKRNNND